MVTRKHSGNRTGGQAGNEARTGRADRRTTSTPDIPYGACTERVPALVALVQWLALLGIEQACAGYSVQPTREPTRGGDRLGLGTLRLCSGLHRLGHGADMRTNAMGCGVLRVDVLPAGSPRAGGPDPR